MKYVYTCLLSVLFFGHLCALDASVSLANFKAGEDTFLEVNLQIIGSTLQYDSTVTYLEYQRGVEVLIMISQKGEIVKYSKYLLHSPSKDVSSIDLIDAKRYFLKDGEYVVRVEMTDRYNPEFVFSFENKHTIALEPSQPRVSSIQLLAKAEQTDQSNSLVKNGLLMEVIPYNFVSNKYQVLKAYVESYGTDQVDSDGFYLAYAIVKEYSGEGGSVWKEKFKKIKKSTATADLLLFDISSLPSGNYHYRVGLYSRDKTLLAMRTENFRRSSRTADLMALQADKSKKYEGSFAHDIPTDELDYVLQAISPAVPPKFTAMANELIKSDNVRSKRYLIFKYFTDSYGDKAEQSYLQYMNIARKVDIEFNDGFGPGFLTDRGYIYLKYGQPNDVIAIEDEPSAPPYQIWIYDFMTETNQSNVKFLFYNPSLSNTYDLLHSTCRYEVSNPRWEIELYSDDLSARQNQNLDSTNMPDGLNRRAREFFDGNN